VSLAPIVAEREVAVPPDILFSFLADLENHWLLTDRFAEVLTLDRPGGGPARGGSVRIRGPLGLGRTAHTRVVDAHPPTFLAGIARVGPRTQARVRWTLAPSGDGALVRLEATVERAAPLDRLLLAAGGRRWLEREFAAILVTLDRRVAGVAQPSLA
jgi:hypothetical protein